MVNTAFLRAQTAVLSYVFALRNKYDKQIRNEWIWLIVFLILGLATLGYAAYCLYVGRSFGGSIKIKVPDTFHVTVGCK